MTHATRPLTDERLDRLIRDVLAERAEDIAAATASADAMAERITTRLRPSRVGRGWVLLAAALLAALLIAGAVAVGSWLLDPIDELNLEPPADVPAFVLSSYERLPQLPPLALTWHNSDSAKGRIYVDRSGAVRLDRFTSADATEPASYTVLSGNTQSGVATVGSDKVWVEPGDPVIGEDPRVFLRTVLRADLGPGCEMERDATEVGDGTAATGWRYVGLEDVAGRPTHHVTCGGGDLWIDIETRLILRTQGPAVDDAGQPIPVEFTEVTEIAFAEQPAALFEPPEGLARMSMEEYNAYVCERDLPNEIAPGISACQTTGEAEATSQPEPSPSPTVRPNTSACAVRPGHPSEPIGPLAWTPENMNEDWPAPVRPEPAGGGSVQPMPLTYLDPTGDNESTAFPCADIRAVMGSTGEVHLKLDSGQPVVDPAETWIAYGIVVDDDRDGVPDWRYGIDNIPADAVDDGPPSRGWRTNLDTGQTDAGPEHSEMVRRNGGGFKSAYPSLSDDAAFLFGGALTTTQGLQEWGFELDMPFYTWASVIVNGRVVATDFAPDAGWLVATRGAWPGGTLLLADPFPDLSMTVPEGWTTSFFEGEGRLSRVACGDLGAHVGPDEHYQADCARVQFDVGYAEELVWSKLCEDTIEPALEPRFEDLVTCAARLGRDAISENVTVDGYRGKHFEYAPETRSVGCPFDCGDVWILDVDGVLLMIGSLPTGDLDGDVPEEAVRAEIRQMVESIHFER